MRSVLSPDKYARMIKDIKDDNFLYTEAMEQTDYPKIRALMDRMGDEALYAIALEHPDSNIRIKAIELIKDSKRLRGIASGNDHPFVRCAAIARIEDSKVLVTEYQKTEDSFIKFAIIKRLNKQALSLLLLMEKKSVLAELIQKRLNTLD